MIRAAGGVLWRVASGAHIEIAVVHRPRYDDWSLPKGKLDPDEHPLLGAVREVREETGMSTRVGRRLKSTSYSVAGVPKTVDYWSMEAVGGQFEAGDEVDKLAWLAPAEVVGALTSRQDAAVIESFLAVPHDTTTVLLVRHGRAGDSSTWVGEDALRPLDETGLRQADALAKLLPVYQPTRVLSADPLRCVDTVKPLAERLGVPVEIDASFGADAHDENPQRAANLLRALGAGGKPAVVCSQGEVIPDSVILLAQRDRVTLPALAARKSSVWALHFGAGQGHTNATLAAADYDARPAGPGAATIDGTNEP